MTTPGHNPGPTEPPPYEIGSNWNQDITEEDVVEDARTRAGAAFTEPFEEFFNLWGGFENLTDFLGQLRDAITKAEIPAPGPLLDIFDKLDGVDDEIVNIGMVLNQIRDLFNGLVVTPINSVVAGVKDWLNDLLGWKSNTTSNHQGLANNVWLGSTSAPLDEDKTAQEVRDAVASLKARSDSLRQENELRYSASVPLWQGLVPGGDVTTNFDNIHIPTSDSDAAVFTPFGANADRYAITAFRARSDVPRRYITGLMKASNPSDAYGVLWSYDEEADSWRIVGITEDFGDDLSTTTYEWMDIPLQEEYNPTVGELMAVSWYRDMNSLYAARSSTPKLSVPYNSVPYGTYTDIGLTASTTTLNTVGYSIPLPKSLWVSGGTPFFQVAPDLGQGEYQAQPTYWFDDFNTNLLGPYVAHGGANISGGRFQYSGSSDGIQRIALKQQMTTEKCRVEATCSYVTSRDIAIGMHNTPDLKFGVGVVINSSTITLTTLDAYGTGTIRATAANTGGAARWKIEFDPTNSTYYVLRNDTQMIAWADTGDLAKRARGRRSAYLGVSRSVFVNSPSWDDFLVYDVTD